MIDWLIQLDKELFLWLNGLHHAAVDPIMVFISAKYSWIPLYLLVFYVILRKHKWETVRILLVVALLIALSDQLSVHLFKLNFQRLRPCHHPDLQNLVYLASGRCGGSFGFVSSHAANSFALATFVYKLFEKDWKYTSIAAFGWAAIVSYSRIYLGVHYPADLIGGMLLGIACGLFIWYSYRFYLKYLCRQRC